MRAKNLLLLGMIIATCSLFAAEERAASRQQSVLLWLQGKKKALIEEMGAVQARLKDSAATGEKDDLEQRATKIKELFQRLNARMIEVEKSQEKATNEHAGIKLANAWKRKKSRDESGMRQDLLTSLAYEKRQEWGLGDQFFVRRMIKSIRSIEAYQKFYWHLFGVDLERPANREFHHKECRTINGQRLSDHDCMAEILGVCVRLYRKKFVYEYDRKVADNESLLGEFESRESRVVSIDGLAARWLALYETFKRSDAEAKAHPLYAKWRKENEKWLTDAHKAAASELGGVLQSLWWQYGTVHAAALTLAVPDSAVGFPAGGESQSNDALNERQLLSVLLGAVCRVVGIVFSNPHGDKVYNGDKPGHAGVPAPPPSKLGELLATELVQQRLAHHLDDGICASVPGHFAAAPARVLLVSGGFDFSRWFSPELMRAHEGAIARREVGALWEAFDAAVSKSNKARWLGGSATEAQTAWQGCIGLVQDMIKQQSNFKGGRGSPAEHGRLFGELCTTMVPWVVDAKSARESLLEKRMGTGMQYSERLKEYWGNVHDKEQHGWGGRTFRRSATKQDELEKYFESGEGIEKILVSHRAAYALFLILFLRHAWAQQRLLTQSFPSRESGEVSRMTESGDTGSAAGVGASFSPPAASEGQGRRLRPDVTTEDWRAQVARIESRGTRGNAAVRRFREKAKEVTSEVGMLVKQVGDQATSLAATGDELRQGNAKEALERISFGLDSVSSAVGKMGRVFNVGGNMLDEMHQAARQALDEGYVRSKIGLDVVQEVSRLELKEVMRKIETARKLSSKFARQFSGKIMRGLSKLGLKLIFDGKEIAETSPEREEDIRKRNILLRRLEALQEGEVDLEQRRKILAKAAATTGEARGAAEATA